MGDQERTYLERRQELTENAIKELLDKNSIPKFDHSDFLKKKTKPIVIALAISGGGYRSMLIGAGVLEAYDSRTPLNNSNLGGLLQSLSYIGGISGGSWLVMSNFVNDFKPMYQTKSDHMSWSIHKQLLKGVPSFDPSPDRGHVYAGGSDEEPISSNKTIIKEYEGFFGSIRRAFRLGKAFIYNMADISKDTISPTAAKDHNKIDDTVAVSDSLFASIIGSLFLKNSYLSTKNSSQSSQERSWKEIFKYYKQLHTEVRDKRLAGFYLSITDYWGRALARRIFPREARAPGATITGCTRLPSFLKHEQPLPIICAVEKLPTYSVSSENSHLFEFTPFEFGSWDAYLNAFIPLRYLGSSLYDGKSTIKTNDPNVSICTSGFDNIGFITGTSSSLFNHVFMYIYSLLIDMKLTVAEAFEKILKPFGLDSNLKSLMHPQLHPDYALYSPNPFYGYHQVGSNITKSPHMYLVDGGDDGQNIPFHPFLRTARKVDIILAFDMTADAFNYPNGTVLGNSAKRFHSADSGIDQPYFLSFCGERRNNLSSFPNGLKGIGNVKSLFPRVPDAKEIVETGLHKRPVFFGCDLELDYPSLSKNDIDTFENREMIEHYLPPLIVYTANAELSYPSNQSTFQMSYSEEEIYGVVQNGYNLATFMNSSFYNTCLNCAILKREFDRAVLGLNPMITGNFSVPSQCVECYDEFCWHSSDSTR